MITDSNIIKELLMLTKVSYPLFADYCNFLDKGHRKEALKSLDEFLDEAKNWDHLTKANFCKTIFSLSTTTSNDIDFVLTTNLTNQLIKPTLLEMTIQEPDNYLAFKWFGQYFQDTTFIKKAHELNPSDNSIKIILLSRLENDIWLSTHHLQDGYLGDIEQDERDIKLAFSLLKNLDAEMSSDFFNRFTDFKMQLPNINRMKKFKRITLIVLFILAIYSCNQTTLKSPIIENIKQGDTLTLFSEYGEWGEWGGHIEKVYLTKKDNNLWVTFYEDTVVRHEPHLARSKVVETTKRLTTADRNCIAKYMDEFKIASTTKQKPLGNMSFVFKIISKDTTLEFIDWQMNWKGFKIMKNQLFD